MTTPSIPPTKRCTKCGEYKPLSEFHKNHATKDGCQYRCKICQSALCKDIRPTPKNIAGHHIETDVIERLKSLGIYAAPGKASEYKWCDVVAWGCVRIEVKSSIRKPDGRYQFNFVNQGGKWALDTDLVILVCINESQRTYHVFPATYPAFYNKGRVKKQVHYDPLTFRHYGLGWNITTAVMNAHQDQWALVEECRQRTIKRLLGQVVDMPFVERQLELIL